MGACPGYYGTCLNKIKPEQNYPTTPQHPPGQFMSGEPIRVSLIPRLGEGEPGDEATSEYAYRDGSVNRAESPSAKCRNYPSDYGEGAFLGNYVHCDGTPLIKLIDSNLGREQYQYTDYYVWIKSGGTQLLFIFPTRVSLTTITLHYYSDSIQGLPRLRFYAVPDDFDAWDAPTTSYPHVDVAADQCY